MKKTLIIISILISGYCYSQNDTVVTKETIITGNDTDIVYTITNPISNKVKLSELKAERAGLQAENAIYQGYKDRNMEKIQRINEKIAKLKAQAQ